MSKKSIFQIRKDGTLIHCSRRKAWGSLTLPSRTTAIGDKAFADCRGLRAVVIPKGVTKIGKSAFYQSGLDRIILNSVRFVDSFAFAHCAFLTEIHIPEVQTIGDSAFAWTSLNRVSLPKSVSKLGQGVFNGSQLITAELVNSHITELPPGTFEFCDGLRFVTLPSTVKTICCLAFESCGSLEKIELPEGLVLIEEYAFSMCTSLREIKIPNSVKCVERKVFAHCHSLDHIEVSKDCKVHPDVGCDVVYRD